MTTEVRKRLLVHTAIQGSLVARFAMHWILFASISCALLIVLQTLFAASQTPELRYQQIRLTIVAFGLVSLALIPAFVFDLLRLSNRFVGPIVRMQGYLKKLDPAAIQPLKIRKQDYWQELVDDVNQAVERLQNHTHQVEQSQYQSASTEDSCATDETHTLEKV